MFTEKREWEPSGGLRLSRQVSPTLERKGVRSVSNGRGEAIRLLILRLPQFKVNPERNFRSRRKFASREPSKVTPQSSALLLLHSAYDEMKAF